MMTPAHKSGFALLLTLIVVSIVLAIGLSILDITLKQYTLSVTSRESEIAFHVADSMIECFELMRLKSIASDFLVSSGSAPDIQCAEFTRLKRVLHPVVNEDGGQVYHYSYQYESDLAGGVCGEISGYMLDARNGAIDNYALNNEGLGTVDCDEGEICTVAFGRGYNRTCSNLSSLRTVQREITISF